MKCRMIHAALVASLLCCVPAHATLSFNVQSVVASAGDVGDVLDVTLTNTGAPLTIGGFSFGLSVADSHIVFTDATIGTTTATYIFNGHSLFGPGIIISGAGTQSLTAGDNYDTSNAGATVGTGATVGLGHVFFNVLAGVPVGPIAVTLASFPTSSLSDNNGNDVTIGVFNNGFITIPSGAVPEPSSLVLLAVGLAALAWARKRLP